MAAWFGVIYFMSAQPDSGEQSGTLIRMIFSGLGLPMDPIALEHGHHLRLLLGEHDRHDQAGQEEEYPGNDGEHFPVAPHQGHGVVPRRAHAESHAYPLPEECDLPLICLIRAASN